MYQPDIYIFLVSNGFMYVVGNWFVAQLSSVAQG